MTSRTLIVAIVALLGSTAWGQEFWPDLPESLRPSPALATVPGTYLAVRHALAQQDWATAANLLAEQNVQGRVELAFAQEALEAYIFAGAFADGLRLANTLEQKGQSTDLADLAKALALIDAGDPAAVLDWLNTRQGPGWQDSAPLLALLAPPIRAFAQAQLGQRTAAYAGLEAREGPPFEISLKTLARARLAEALDDQATAERAYGRLTTALARNAQALKFAGDFQARQGRFAAAAARYRQAAEGGVFVPPAWATQGEVLPSAPGRPQPKPTLTSLSPSVLLTLSWALEQEEEDPSRVQVRALLQAAAWHLSPENPLVRLRLSRTLTAQGRDVALIRLNAGQAISPTIQLPIAQLLGRALLRQGELDVALDVARRTLIAHPEAWRLHLIVGDAHLQQQNFGHAAEAFAAAARAVPGDDSAAWLPLFRLGVARHQDGRFAEAQTAFLRSLQRDPNRPATLNYLGYSWVDANHRVDEGLALIERAVVQSPETAAYVDSLGWAYYRLGRFEDARDMLQRAVDLAIMNGEDSEFWILLDHLGDAHAALGDQRSAVFAWRQALSFLPDDPDQTEARQALEGKIGSDLP